MLHSSHIDTIIVLVGANPRDPDDALLEINRSHKPISIALDSDYNTFGQMMLAVE
jgi:hypothetical protein